MATPLIVVGVILISMFALWAVFSANTKAKKDKEKKVKKKKEKPEKKKEKPVIFSKIVKTKINERKLKEKKPDPLSKVEPLFSKEEIEKQEEEKRREQLAAAKPQMKEVNFLRAPERPIFPSSQVFTPSPDIFKASASERDIKNLFSQIIPDSTLPEKPIQKKADVTPGSGSIIEEDILKLLTKTERNDFEEILEKKKKQLEEKKELSFGETLVIRDAVLNPKAKQKLESSRKKWL